MAGRWQGWVRFGLGFMVLCGTVRLGGAWRSEGFKARRGEVLSGVDLRGMDIEARRGEV